MLVPEVIEILGGVVDELEAARIRLVSEVNKPPRGNRYVLSLSISEHVRFYIDAISLQGILLHLGF
jgi:hypothetical protein